MDSPNIPPDFGHKVLSSVRWVAVIRTISQTFTWLSTIIVVRFISPEDYGLNAMLQAPLELMTLVCTLGIDAGLVRLKMLHKTDLQSAFGWLLVLNALLFSVYFFGSSLLAAYFAEPRLETLAKVLALIFVLVPFRAIPNALLDRELKFKAKAMVELIAAVCAAIITLVLAIMGNGIWALIIGTLSKRIIATVLLMVRYPWFIKPTLGIRIKPLVGFGGLVTLSSALNLLSGTLISFVAGRFLGAEILGLYFVAARFAMLPLSKTMNVLGPLIFPTFSKLQDHPEKAGYYLQRAMATVSTLLLPIIIGIACIAAEFVAVVLGARWADVAIPLVLISLITPFRMISGILRPVTNGMGQPMITIKASVVRLMLAAAILPFAMDHGAIGLAAMWLAIDPIATFIHLLLSKAAVRISLTKLARLMLPSFVATGAMAIAIFGLKIVLQDDDSAIELVTKVACGAAVYGLTMFVFFREETRRTTGILFARRGNAKTNPTDVGGAN